ncbi:MAG: hypothetical protein K2Q18_07325 [Bdellovibrionales bacterium]|nr:hypothetical protein [Bdellovibrionales bacterium]
MKMLALSMLLFAARTYASGCDHYDVSLVSEKAIVSLGEFEATYYCNESNTKKCHVYGYNQMKDEYHVFYKQYDGTEETIEPTRPLGNIDIKIYEQYFESSCGNEYRYILGVDIEGKRYREVDDIDEM